MMKQAALKLRIMSVAPAFAAILVATIYTIGLPRDAALAQSTKVRLTDYGDDVSAFRKALNILGDRGGGILDIPNGTYHLSSSELALPLRIDSNISIEGNGSRLVVTGDAVSSSVFGAENASHITIRNLTATGNGKAIDNSASGQFFKYVLSADAGADHGNITVDKVRLDNFSANRWISFTNFNEAGFRLSGFTISDVIIQSRSGNSLHPDKIGTWASALVFNGYRGAITDIEISGFRADAAYIKSGIGLLDNVSSVKITNPNIRHAGRYGASDNSGGYAILVYSKPGAIHDVTITAATIVAPRSAGLYAAGANNITVSRGIFTGQSDDHDQTIPKGALAFNAVENFNVDSVKLRDNIYDISIVARSGKANTSVGRFHNIDAKRAKNASILFNPANGLGESGELFLSDSSISANGRGIHILNGIVPGRTIKVLDVRRSIIESQRSHAMDLSPYGSVNGGFYSLKSVTLHSAGAAIYARKLDGDFHFDDVVARTAPGQPSSFIMQEKSRVCGMKTVRLQK